MGKRKKKARAHATGERGPSPAAVPPPAAASVVAPSTAPASAPTAAPAPISTDAWTPPDPETISPDVPAGPEFLPPRGPAGPATIGGLLVRMAWLIVGPAVLFVIAASILVERLPVGHGVDVLYGLVAFGVTALYRLERQRGAEDRAVLPGREGTFVRTFLGVAAIGLCAVHLLGACLPD